MKFNINYIQNIIDNSQRCQRNWDLSKQISDDHIETLKVSVKKCPSKQNITFYKCVFITNRDIIEKIHSLSDCFIWQFDPQKAETNSQTLANLLVVFVRDRDLSITKPRNISEYSKGLLNGKSSEDENKSVGIAAGSLNLTAHLLGYKTGFYNAMHNNDILSNMFNGKVFLIIGIGHPDETKKRTQHHLTDFIYPSFDKIIKIDEIK